MKASLPDPEFYWADLNTEVPSTSYYHYRAEYCITDTLGEGRKHSAIPAVWQVDGRFKCDMCDRDYGSSRGLSLHMQSQNGGVRYGCDQCTVVS